MEYARQDGIPHRGEYFDRPWGHEICEVYFVLYFPIRRGFLSRTIRNLEATLRSVGA